MQLAADPGHPMAGLSALWAEEVGGVGGAGVWGIFIIFSLKKPPTLPATPHPVLCHYSSCSHSPDAGAVIQMPKWGGGLVPHSQAVVAGWVAAEVSSGLPDDTSGTVGRSWCWTQQGGRCPLPSQRVWMQEWLAEMGHGGAKLSLGALSRQGSRATGCQCSLWECHASRKKRLSPLKSTQEDLFPRISYLGNLHHSSKAECLFGKRKWDVAPSQRLPVGSITESLRRHLRQLLARSAKGRAGWAGGPAGVCCLCRVLQSWLWSCKVSGIFLLQHKGIKLD